MPPKSITPAELRAAIDRGDSLKLLDVRSPRERALARIEPSQLLDQTLATEIVQGWDRSTRLVLYCHHGIRSANAAAYFAEQGFADVSNVSGGIDRWSLEVDPAMPRY